MYYKLIAGWWLLLTAVAGYGQAPSLTGTVLDDYGHPLAGVVIHIKGGTVSAISGKDGAFTIDAGAGSVLVLEHPRFEVREWKTGRGKQAELRFTERPLGTHTIRYTPTGDTIYLQLTKPERLDVLYGQADADKFVGSIATTRMLSGTPAPSYLYALPGRLAGLNVQQTSGMHTSLLGGLTSVDIFVGNIPNNTSGAGLTDNTDFNVQLRGHNASAGQSPIAIIDGVQREFYELEPENIESVSILKDALSNILLGQNSARGALVVTSLRPQAGPPRVSFTAETGVQKPLGLPTPLPSYQYAYLLNEALLNDGKSPAYTAADFDAYRNHTDPIGHPDVNWYNTILRKNAALTRYNLNVTGGSGIARYLVSLNYMDQQGMFVTSGKNPYNTNADIKRYTLNSKIDIDVNQYFTLGLQLFGRLQDGNQPGVQTSSILSGLLSTPNNAYPVYNTNGSYGGNTNYVQNLLGQVISSGYIADHTRDVMANLDLSYKMDKWVKGWWVKAKGNVSVSESGLLTRAKVTSVYNEIVKGVGDTSYNQYGQTVNQSNIYNSTSWGRYRFVQLSTGWDHNYGDHHVSGMLLYDQKKVIINYDIPSGLTNYAAKGNYEYQDKYFAEAAATYSGYDRYAPGHQYGWFYAGGLGWNMAKERFLSGSSSWLDKLKLRVTYGRTGNANVDNYGYFIWRQHYSGVAGTYGIGSNYPNGGGLSEQGTPNNQSLANVNATWEKADKLNAGLDVSILHNRLQLTVDYYHERYSDLMQTRGNSLLLMGVGYPAENIGIDVYKGLEMNLTYQDHVGELNYYFTGNASFQQSRVIFMDEQYQQYAWNVHTGHPVGQRFGLQADGLFQTGAEAAAAPAITGYVAHAGDVRYKDLNKDGIIDQFDVAPIGKERPVIYYGLTVGASFKGIEASVLVQGAMHRDEYISDNYVDAGFLSQFNGYSQAYQAALSRWIPESAQTAAYPRLTAGLNPNNFNPYLASSYFLRNGDYWRIKNVSVAYNLPYAWVKKIKLRGVKIFANAVNLWTHAAYKGVDPEVSLPSYPIQKVINTGITVKL
jgi:TonB-linked SusC/RagA family outer membrane protein